MYVRTYIHTYYIHTHTFTYIHTHTFTYIHTHTYVFFLLLRRSGRTPHFFLFAGELRCIGGTPHFATAYVRNSSPCPARQVCVCVCISMYIYVRVCVCTHIHTLTHTNTHTHTHRLFVVRLHATQSAGMKPAASGGVQGSKAPRTFAAQRGGLTRMLLEGRHAFHTMHHAAASSAALCVLN
jgi:hypothetical protein